MFATLATIVVVARLAAAADAAAEAYGFISEVEGGVENFATETLRKASKVANLKFTQAVNAHGLHHQYGNVYLACHMRIVAQDAIYDVG